MNEIKRKIATLLSPGRRGAAFWLVTMMIIGSLFEVVGVASIPAFITLLGKPELVQEYNVLSFLYKLSGASSEKEFLLIASMGLIGLFVVKNTYLGLLSVFKARFIFDTQHDVGTRLFAEYLHRPYSFHLQHNSAELLRNVKENASIVVTAFLFALVTIIMESLNVVFIFVLLLVVEPVVSIIAVCVLGGVSLAFLMAIKKKTMHFGEDEQVQHQKMIEAISHGLGGLKESIVLQRQKYFLDAFAASSKKFARARKFRRVMEELPQRVIETIAVLGMLLIAVVFLARGGAMAVVLPVLALFGTAAIKLMPSMKVIVSSIHSVQYYRFAVDHVCDELRAGPVEIEDAPITSERRLEPRFDAALELDKVAFKYAGSEAEALKGISLRIKKGSAVAFVGTSGAGKTTLVDLLLGILEPTAGVIRVDGESIYSNLPKWQRQLGYIPQQIFLADDSITKNIAFGIPEERIDRARIHQVAEIAQLDDFVYTLPDRFETIIGEGGVRLSGGQRQRIGIARALYHDPEILVMDEATSALDNRTERFFMDALQRLRDNHTIIMIAHRLSTVRECDELFMMDHGKVTASGTYNELIAVNEAFQDIAAVH